MFFFRGTGGDREEFEAETRQVLLARMVDAYNAKNQQDADRALVNATRWLTTHPGDAVILEARNQLRTRFPPRH